MVVNRHRVIFCNRYFYPDHSATSQILSDLAFALAKAGHEVHVVTSRLGYEDTKAALPAREEVRGVVVHRVRTTRFGRMSLPGRALDYLSYYLTATIALLGLVQRGDVLVAKTDPPLLSVLAAWVARWRGAQLVNWMQDIFPEVAISLGVRGFNGALGRTLVRIRNRALPAAAVNVAIGERMKERLIDIGLPEERIRVIHNWADGEQIRPIAAQRNALRREWGLEGRFVVGYSGNLGRAHGHETILGAAQRLREEKRIVFLLIGGGTGMEKLRREAQAQGLDNIVFKPYQPRERLAESLGAADVHLVVLRPEMEGLIVPSKFYGISAAGRAALFIGDPAGEIGRIVTQWNNGKVVAPRDSAGLAAELLRLSEDAALLHTWGERARRCFDGRFRRDYALAAWSELLGALPAAAGQSVVAMGPARALSPLSPEPVYPEQVYQERVVG